MPTEAVIKKKALELLRVEGETCWCPPKVKYLKEVDIFGVFDCICWKGYKMRLIQWTTLHHKTDRIKKIQDFVKGQKNSPQLYSPDGVSLEVWGYDEGYNKFHLFSVDV